MKKYTIILLALISLLNTSCAGLLDTSPEDRQSIGNAFDSEGELMAFVTTIEGELQRLMSYDPHEYAGTFATRCDNSAYLNLRNLVGAQYKNSFYSDWNEYYDVIYLSNLILENISQADGKLDQDRIDFYKGQAYFARGWMYYEVGKMWGNAIITTGTNNFAPYGNSTDEEVIAKAISDMEQAYALLGQYGDQVDDSGITITIKQYGCTGSAAALLAEMYAWQGSMAELYGWESVNPSEAYTSSVEWSTKLIDGDESGPYSLASDIPSMLEENFGSLDQTARPMATEAILEIQNYYLTDNSGGYASPIIERYLTWPVDTNDATSTILTGQVAFKIDTTDVRALFADTDARRDAYFYEFDSLAAEGYEFAYPYKVSNGVYRVYSATSSRFAGVDANEIYIRLAGVYLLRAECNVKLGNDGLAAADLNVIRARANADLYPAADDTDLQYAIFKERDRELLFERNRFYAVLRNNYIKTELSDAFASLSDADINDGALYLYIGDEAFENNTLLRQNVYWNRVQ